MGADQEEPVPTDAVAAEREAELQVRMWGMHHVSVNHAVRVLNELLEADPEAMKALFECRVPCNRAMGGHPTVQVALREGADKTDFDNGYEVGVMGIINAIFGAIPDGRGYLCFYQDKSGVTPITHFGVTDADE
jgi:hypothetical protein